MASLTHDHCQKLFNSFWELSDFNQRNAFLFGQIQAARPARRYADAAESRRQFTFLFYVKDNCGESVRVCKQAFLSIFGLQNSRGRINNIMTQIVSGSGTPKSDNRGKHHNRPNRTESSILDDVITTLIHSQSMKVLTAEKITLVGNTRAPNSVLIQCMIYT